MKNLEPEIESKEELQPEQVRMSFFAKIKARLKDRKQKKFEQIEKERISEEQNEEVKEKIEEVNREVKEKSGKNKKIRNIIFFVFNIALVVGILVWNILSSDDFTPLDLLDVSFGYIAVIALFLAVIILIDVLTVHRMIYRKTMRSRWHLSYKSVANLRYYDAVTPMTSGGQAFMTTYLMSRDIDGPTSLSIPIAKLVFQQISWLIITFVCLMVSVCSGIVTNSGVLTTSIVGFVIVFCMVLLILTISFSKKFGEKLVSGCVKLLVKMKILKNYEKNYTKVINFVGNYQAIMKEYSRSIFDVIYQIILHSLRYICLFSIPFFISCSFKNFDSGKYVEFFLFTALIDLSSSFIPLPGGTGMNEITFTALFYKYLGGATFWALLIWRFCSYYYYLLQGILLLTYDTVYGNRKYRWIKKRLELQEESQEFKRLQIENFRKARNKRRKQQK